MNHGIRVIGGLAITTVLLMGCTPAGAPSTSSTAATAPPASPLATVAPASPSASAAPASPSASAATEFSWSLGTTPTGWAVEEGAIVHNDNAYIEVMTDRSVMAADCGLGPQAGVGRTATEIMKALAERKGLDTGGGAPITIGGLRGQQLDIALETGWKGNCPWWEDAKAPVVPLIGTFDEKNLWNFNAVAAGEQFRYIVLDTPNGGNVLVAITAVAPEHLQDITKDAMQIAGNLEFVVPG